MRFWLGADVEFDADDIVDAVRTLGEYFQKAYSALTTSAKPDSFGKGRMEIRQASQVRARQEFMSKMPIPDPPAILICEVCNRQLVKNSVTMGSECHGRPMKEFQPKAPGAVPPPPINTSPSSTSPSSTSPIGRPVPQASDEIIRGGAFSKMNPSSSDEEEFAKIQDLAMTPDPPAIMVCKVCGFEVPKSSEWLPGVKHCEQLMVEEQRKKSIDMDLLRTLFKAKGLEPDF